MIRVAEGLWVGDSDDARGYVEEIDGVLNVAQDLQSRVGWPYVEHMQVGLIDGPGNELVTYNAAVMALVTLCRRHKGVLIYDHKGGRAMAVSAMYLNLIGGKFRLNPLSWSHWLTWDERIREIKISETDEILPTVHEAHKHAFAKLPYGLLEALL